MSESRLQLGGLVLDLAAGELLAADQQPAVLRRQALELLIVLGRRAGQVVTKDELMERVWPGVVVGEGSLTQAIADVRRALGDSGHRMLRNVARRGYMLVPDSPADAPLLSIAVMPLAVEGDAAGSDWFAQALHADLVDEVARIHGSLVIATDTAATYAGRTIDPRQVARELRVRHVVLGRLRHEGSQIRVALVLVDGESGVQRWADAFAFERADLAQGLADCAMQIVRALVPEIYVAAAHRTALSPLEVSADDLAMRAMVLWVRGFNRDNTLEGIRLLERAVALDPDSVRGWNRLIVSTLQALMNGWLPDPAAALGRIQEAAAQLERVDHEGNYNLQAKVILAYLGQDIGALLRLTAAWTERDRHPNAFGARGMAALVNGEPDLAVTALETALRLSPRDSFRAEWQYRLAMAHFLAGRYELACDWAQTAADTNPALSWPPIHAAAMLLLGQEEEAKRAFDAFIQRHAGFRPEHLVKRLPGANPKLVEARERLTSSLKQLGTCP